jgi:organic hydroperoxide reductase OsmC/OhrA
MSDQLQFSVNGHWAAGEQGYVAGQRVGNAIEFSTPPEFHGEAGFWTPEHFLLAAVASCFVATFRAIAAFSKFDPVGLDISVEGKLDKGPAGYEFTGIVLRPRLAIRDENSRLLARRFLEKTERSCLIARALKCAVTMEPTINVAEAARPELHAVEA